MRLENNLYKQFLNFSFFSGIGWLCDFCTFVILVQWLHTGAFVGNFISSYVGLTFVFFTSVRFVFYRYTDSKGLFLGAYWGWQFFSILAYSTALDLLVNLLADQLSTVNLSDYVDIIGKIIITPVNLLTNFMFMKILSSFMKERIR